MGLYLVSQIYQSENNSLVFLFSFQLPGIALILGFVKFRSNKVDSIDRRRFGYFGTKFYLTPVPVDFGDLIYLLLIAYACLV